MTLRKKAFRTIPIQNNLTPITPSTVRFFNALAPWRHKIMNELSPVRYFVLSHSLEAHQNLLGSTPEVCSGVDQKGCDFERDEGAAPPSIHALKP